MGRRSDAATLSNYFGYLLLYAAASPDVRCVEVSRREGISHSQLLSVLRQLTELGRRQHADHQLVETRVRIVDDQVVGPESDRSTSGGRDGRRKGAKSRSLVVHRLNGHVEHLPAQFTNLRPYDKLVTYTYIQINIAPKLVKTNLRRWHRMTRW